VKLVFFLDMQERKLIVKLEGVSEQMAALSVFSFFIPRQAV